MLYTKLFELDNGLMVQIEFEVHYSFDKGVYEDDEFYEMECCTNTKELELDPMELKDLTEQINAYIKSDEAYNYARTSWNKMKKEGYDADI